MEACYGISKSSQNVNAVVLDNEAVRGRGHAGGNELDTYYIPLDIDVPCF